MAYIGQYIGSKYRISGMLDEGGMSRVYLAVDESIGKEWAVKEVPLFPKDSPDAVKTYAALKEAEIIKDLDHHSIVRIVDIIRNPDAVYIVEDLVKGISLGDLLRSGRSITENELVSWAIQICSVLEYLHDEKHRIIYRDIKPDNIILTDSGQIKLIDFGIARKYSPDKKRDTQYLGTAQFAAPEQYEDFGTQTDKRTDIYGLGCTLMYMSGACANVSFGFRKIIKKCIQPIPSDRYQNVQHLMKDLEKLSEGTQTRIRKVLPVLSSAVLVAALIISGSFLKIPEAYPSGSMKGGDELYEIYSLLDELYETAVNTGSEKLKEGDDKDILVKDVEKLYIDIRMIFEEDSA